jgi:hypothetical protein
MGGEPSCAYKNQGERIWEMNHMIYENLDLTRDNIKGIKAIVTQHRSNKNIIDGDQNVKYSKAAYRAKLKEYLDIDTGLENNTINQLAYINQLLDKINEKYGGIKDNIEKNDVTINKINANKKEILQKSNSIVYFENLLLAAYLEIYNSVLGQNKAIVNNQSSRIDMYSIDNSTYVYQQKRIQFYKNLNTGLFFTYYALILVLVYVIIRLNSENSILVKLTLFRLFVVILIGYPLFILRFQKFIYSLFHYFYERLAPNQGL